MLAHVNAPARATADAAARPVARPRLRSSLHVNLAVGAAVLIALYLTSRHNYLLFHSLAEVFCVAVAGGIFMFAWSSRRYLADDYFPFLGAAFLTVGVLDLLHALAYYGIGVFPNSDANLATQLWIAAGSIKSAAFLASFLVVGRRLPAALTFAGFAAAGALVLLLIFAWPIFPDCYLAGSGLTPFKKVSEYAISLTLVAALVALLRQRAAFSPRVWRLLATSLVLGVLAELVFTLYLSVYGPWNLAGHFLKLISYYLVYHAIIHTGLVRPSDLLFRQLTLHEAALERSQAELEQRVAERTRELADSNAALRAEVAAAEELHRQLQHAQKMEAIGTLAGGIAHDFNNILTPILGYTELVRDNLPAGGDDRRALDEVMTAGRRAKALVSQILMFSRRRDQQRAPVDLRDIVAEVLQLVRATLPATIEIRHDLTAARGWVMADPAQLHQVLMNLCTNAYQAMRATGGVLGVSLCEVDVAHDRYLAALDLRAGPHLRLEVADTGPGVPPDIIDRIFEPYFTTKPTGEGTGLGLSTVHGIVHSHGGRVTVYSEPGAGTTFHVYLPCVDEDGASDLAVAPPGPLEVGTERLLVVDDEPAIAELMRVSLAGLGYAVTAVTESRAALALLTADPRRVDLVLTDMTMPAMTGVELARALLALRPDLPIILCTGFSELVTGPDARTLGIRGFLRKPVVRRDLARTVRAALDGPDPLDPGCAHNSSC